MTRRLILLRHGQTEYNATRRMQGQLDTDLSDTGRAQAHQAAEHLRAEGISRIISSDLARAFDTAAAVAGLLDLEISTDPRLRETDLGRWQGKTHAEVDEELPGARALWRHDATWSPPGGESRIQVAQRARAVIEELMREFEQWDDSAVLVVAHSGTISALTSSLLNLDITQYPMFSGLGNTNSSRLSARPRFLPGSNDANGEAEPDPLSARFHEGNIENAQWYLDGWNVGA